MSPSSHSVDYQSSQAYEDVDIAKVQDVQLQKMLHTAKWKIVIKFKKCFRVFVKFNFSY